MSAFGPRNTYPNLPSTCCLNTTTWPVRYCGGEKREKWSYVQKMIQCKSERTLCEVSKCLTAHKQQKDFLHRISPGQQMWIEGKRLRHSWMRSLATSTLHALCLLWDWTGSVESDRTDSYKSYFQTLKKYIIFKTADPRWPGRAEFLYGFLNHWGIPWELLLTLTVAFLWKPH